jgi:hypothetical protein
MRRGLSAILVAGALLLDCAMAGAAPFSIQLGPDRLVLDTPQGFSDTAGFGSPRLTELAENLSDPSSRVLVFALSDADSRRFSAGDPLELRRYLVTVTPRTKERERMSLAQFGKLVEDIERNFDPAFSSPEDYRVYMGSRPAGRANLLAKLRREPHLISLLYGTMVPQPPPSIFREDKPPVFKLSTMTLALIGGRALYVSAFSTYDSPADVYWIRSLTETWVEELQRLNK